MFTILYLILFIIFFSLGVFIGKKYQEQFFFNKLISLSSSKSNPLEIINKQNTSPLFIELSKQYDTIGEVSKGISFLGILKDRIDLILLKENDTLSLEDQYIKKLITTNKVFLRIIVQVKE